MRVNVSNYNSRT